MTTTLLQDPFYPSYGFRTRRADSIGPFPSSSSSVSSLGIGVDSSPPSSPGLPASDDSRMSEVDADVDAESESEAAAGDTDTHGTHWATLNTSPAHPFSASTHATRRPPLYAIDSLRARTKRRRSAEAEAFVEKHERVSKLPVFDPLREEQRELEPAHIQDNYRFDPYSCEGVDNEAQVWEKTLENVIQHAVASIYLPSEGLTYIPPGIEDLSKLVVLNSRTVAPRDAAPSRTVSVSTNSSSVIFSANRMGTRSDEIHMILSSNKIKYLPRELFSLDSLTVLSLRSNLITEIPPEIGRLRNLRELHLSNNRLAYLPAELMKLSLASLTVTSNPFMPNPKLEDSLKGSGGRCCGPTNRLHDIAPLSELCLRVLMAPHTREARHLLENTRPKTVLEALYDLPIPSDYDMSPGLRDILASCVPASVTSSIIMADSSPDELRRRSGTYACVSECPSNRHLEVWDDGAYSKPVFIGHTEERMTWEKVIAGQKVDYEGGVPVLWRGCSGGCLDFLDDSGETQEDMDMDGDFRLDLDNADDNGGFKMICLEKSAPTTTDFSGMFSSEDIDLDD